MKPINIRDELSYLMGHGISITCAFLLFLSIASAQEVFSDYFEAGMGNWWNGSIGGACTTYWTASTTTPINVSSSAYTVNVDCRLALNRTQDLTGYYQSNNRLNVSFSIKTVGLDAGEMLNFSWWNGSVWNLTLSLNAQNLPYANYTYNLGVGANRTDFKMSFICYTSATAETCQVDNVRIHGTTMGEAPPANNATIISFNYPADASTNTTTQNIQFGYTPIFYGGKQTNCSLYTNRTGTWAWTSANATAVTNNSLNTITYDFGADTILKWSIGCYNNLNLNFTQGNRTLTINTAPPVVVHGIYAGSDPLTLSTAMQHEPGSTPLFWAQARNSSGAGISGKTITLFVYDANRNERSTANMVQFKAGLYYYASHVLSANDNGTFMLFANTTENGVNITAMATFLVRAFASGTGSGGLDTNQNATLYQAMWYSQQANTTLNKSTDQSVPFLQQINNTLNQTIYPATYNISQNIWNYSGTRNLTTFNNLVADVWAYSPRTLTSFGTLVADIWGYAPRTLSDYSGVWNYAVRTLTGFDFKVVTSGGNVTNVTSPIYCANCSSGGGATANDVWTYTARNLTQAVGSSNLTSCGQGNSNLSATDVWDATIRTLTQAVGSSNLTYCGAGNSNLTASDVWGYSPRELTQIVGTSTLTAPQVWEYTNRNLTMNFSNITNVYNNYTNTTNVFNITNVYNLTTNTTNYNNWYNFTSKLFCQPTGRNIICVPIGGN